MRKRLDQVNRWAAWLLVLSVAWTGAWSAPLPLPVPVKSGGTFTHTPEGGQPQVTEGYEVGGKAYKVAGGKAVSDAFGITVAWVSWPMNILQPIGLASSGAAPAPADTLDGRTADVFDLDTARVDPATLAMIQGMMPLNPQVNAAKGRIWIDQQTGGLLKLTLDYQGEFKDSSSGKSLGAVSGHAEVAVTQVGQVKVSLP